MITLAIRLKNIAFLIIAVLVLGYLGVRYADLGHYVGMRSYYTVKVQLPRPAACSPTPTSPTAACPWAGSVRSSSPTTG